MSITSNMSQRIKEFVRRSGVEIQSPDSDDNLANELENILEKAEERRPYEGAFRQFETNSPLDNEFAGLNNNNLRNLLGPDTLEMTPLNPGMFNATVDSGFGQKDVVLDLKKILMKRPMPKAPIGEGLYLDTTEIKGWYGSMREGFSHTRNAGPKGNINIPFFTAQFKMVLSNALGDSKGVTVNIYKNGKIRFSGGFVGPNIANQPELIRRYVVNTYTERQPFLFNPFTYNNLSGQFRINGFFRDLANIALRSATYGAMNASHEPELSPFLYVYFKNAKFILSKTGNVQISGAKSPADMLRAYEIGKSFMQSLNNDGHIVITGQFDEGTKPKPKAKAKAKVATPKPKRKYAKRAFDAKACARMKKPELIEYARRMGVVNFRVRGENGFRAAKKDEICKKILNKSGNKPANNVFRVGKKICRQMKKDELLRTAAVMKLDVDAKNTKDVLCKKIEQAVKKINTPKPSPSPPKPKGVNVRAELVKLYGKRWMDAYKNVMPSLNNDVQAIKSRLTKPTKKNIKAIVDKWKNERRVNLEKKRIVASLNVNGIPRNKVSNYKKGALNYIMTHKPTKAKLAKYKKTWMKKNSPSPKPAPPVKAKRERMI